MSQDHDHDHGHDQHHDAHPGAFPDDALPEGAVVDGASLARDVEDSFDYVVVGSGAAGAVAAHTLARAGFSVAIVEEGPWVKTREFGERVYDAFRRMYRDAGTQVIEGRSYIPLIQGRCVGGSTVMNSAIAHRTPEDVLAEWHERFGLRDHINAEVLAPHFDALERDLNVHAVDDDVLGVNNRMFLDEASHAGLPARKMHRYERELRGLGALRAGLPERRQAGDERELRAVGALARRAHLLLVPRRARRRRGRPRDRRPRDTRRRRRRRRPHVARGEAPRAPRRRRRGEHDPDAEHPAAERPARARHRRALPGHPGVGLGGVFDQPVEMNFGATQGAECTHLRKTERIKLETIAMPPELAAVRIPGIGQELMKKLRRLLEPRGVGGRRPRRGRGDHAAPRGAAATR